MSFLCNGQRMYDFAKKIFPYCRSITGEGVRKTLSDLKEYIGKENGPELIIYGIKTGTEVFDWTVPKEWVIREAYIENKNGHRIIDMQENNLHVMGYSTPVNEWVNLDEMKKHIYTLRNQPDVIPYVTSYYQERYGFCMSENQLRNLPDEKYHIVIDSTLVDGEMNYAEVIIPGKCDKEIFFSTYFCHPSMANNECSGPALAAELIRYVASLNDRRYTYRFIFIPETIGSIAYMSQNEHLAHMKRTMVAGFNLSCVGDDRNYSIVESKYANTLADKVLKNVLNSIAPKYITYSYLKRASDERQYNAPGVDLPVVCFCRSKFKEYEEYHTSADNMSIVSPAGFQGSYDVMTNVIIALEHNCFYKSAVYGEPCLGKRHMYPTISYKGSADEVEAIVNFIAYADGKNDLIDISNIINLSVKDLVQITQKLIAAGLLISDDENKNFDDVV